MRFLMLFICCIYSFFLCNCSISEEKVFDLDESAIIKLSFSDLPAPVSKYIESNIDSIDKSDKEFYTSLDKEITFTYGRSSRSDTWLSEVNSNYHHFFIDGVHYRIRGNKGAPFIIYNGQLYFCSLNLYKEDYTLRPYYKISLPNIIKP